ncbi:metallophosphoesterase [Zavarzinia sp.]|jgi:predicted phosphodiesterase|uniref:metallophosphoesterase n=1 Tax=Zavarzinia sp. TaxID=2027920 RepID=UPI0035680360
MPGARWRSPEETARILAAYDATSGKRRLMDAAAALGCHRSTVARVVAERAGRRRKDVGGAARDGKGPGPGQQSARSAEVGREGETAPAEVTIADGTVTATDRLYSLDDLLRFGAADLSRFYVVSHRFGWYGPTRNPSVENLVGLRPLPGFMLPDAAPPAIRRLPAPPKGHGAPRVTVAFGDTHFGASRDPWTSEVIPYHDEHALDCALQLVEHLAPDAIVFLGDGLDLPEFSTKYDRDPEQEYTTGIAVEAARAWLQALRRTARHAAIYWTEGNHDRRIRDYMRKVAKAAAVLRNPDGAHSVDLPRLLGLADLDVEFVPADRDVRIDDVRYVHGDNREWADLGAVKSRGGATAAEMLKAATECTVYGHTHKAELGARRLHVGGGYRRIWVASPGGLMRPDGVLPGERPDEDRTQGAAVVTSWPDGRASLQLAEIDGGVLTLGQRRWASRVDSCASQAAA